MYVCMYVYMFLIDSETTEPIRTKFGMSPTYHTRMVLGLMPMTLAPSNWTWPIATEPHGHRFEPNLA